MKFSESWLRTWFNPELDTQGLAEQLTMAGLEVGGIEPAAPEFTHVVVGEVVSVRGHSNADRLRVCEVATGQNVPVLSIVCGASNVASHMKVAVALVGAKLLDGIEITERLVRGESSQGMLCAANELGLAEDSDGIMELPGDAPVGHDLRHYLQLDDVCFDLELTPNRGDCLSIRGLARELAVLNEQAFTRMRYEPVEPTHDVEFPVFIEASHACFMYLGRVIRDVGVGGTPIEVKEQLRRSGIRPIHPVVDATQYVMLMLGQPMHAFDLRELEDQVVVRFAQKHETLTLLDGRNIELDTQNLVICDAKKPIALAGVMGGAHTCVGGSTKEVFLECAVFESSVMAGVARSFGLHTDASHRFERGVDPQVCHQAMELATELIVKWTGATVGPVITAADQFRHHWHRPPVTLLVSHIKRLLGAKLPLDWAHKTLTNLGCEVQIDQNSDAWQVECPVFRHDLHREVDLIEELARIYGYHRLPTRVPKFELAAPLAEQQAHRSVVELRSKLTSLGYQAVVNYSFIDPKWCALFDEGFKSNGPGLASSYLLRNPIAEELSVMRFSLWPGLLKNLVYNQNRHHRNLKLFEVGVCFLPTTNTSKRPIEENRIAGLWCGSRLPVGWLASIEEVGFFDIKGDLEQFLYHLSGRVRYVSQVHPVLHPQQCAEVRVDDEFAGWLGRLHPSLAKKLGIEGNVYVFELIYKRIEAGKLPVFQEVSKYPEVKRDIAMLFPEHVLIESIIAEAKALRIDSLKDITLFDVYVGEGVGEGLKSLAFSFKFQGRDKTLNEHDVQANVNRIVHHWSARYQAVLR